MAVEMVSFQEATSRLARLLMDCGFDGSISWVFREDLVGGSKGRIYVRVPISQENRRLAEEEYERGASLSFGVELAMLCRLGAEACCYVWVPRDIEDAEYALLAGLKLSVPTAPPIASPLQASFVQRVKLALWRGRPNRWAERVPSKCQRLSPTSAF